MALAWGDVQEHFAAETGHNVVIVHTKSGIYAGCSCGFHSPRVDDADQAEQLALGHVRSAIKRARDIARRARAAGR